MMFLYKDPTAFPELGGPTQFLPTFPHFLCSIHLKGVAEKDCEVGLQPMGKRQQLPLGLEQNHVCFLPHPHPMLAGSIWFLLHTSYKKKLPCQVTLSLYSLCLLLTAAFCRQSKHTCRRVNLLFETLWVFFSFFSLRWGSFPEPGAQCLGKLAGKLQESCLCLSVLALQASFCAKLII